MSDHEEIKNKWREPRFGQPGHGSGHFPVIPYGNGYGFERNRAAGQSKCKGMVLAAVWPAGWGWLAGLPAGSKNVKVK